LAYILLHSRIINKITSKSVVLLIDEPDVYLHQGLQKKLLRHLRELTANSQIIITTHSPIFINSYTLENVFLLDLDISETTYKRRNKNYSILRTENIDLNQINGGKKIREYLGIDEADYELLDNYNIIVEGETDKLYLEELSKFFGLTTPKIIPSHGADNILQYLSFYQSFYNEKQSKPCLLVLLDNDNKGREIFKKIESSKKKLNFLQIQISFIPNFLGDSPEKLEVNGKKINTDNQIEDFLYPKLICELVNRLLSKKKLQKINAINIEKKIQKPAFKDRGILALIESEKNENNPDNGQIIIVVAQSKSKKD
jgi:predicted ATP-dependent endonuclease of OLD family